MKNEYFQSSQTSINALNELVNIVKYKNVDICKRP
jgi:hypothetical protein